jgi:hypothetical protein
MDTIQKNDKTFSDYGSIAWANLVLRLGIAECKNVGRVEFARHQEILYCIRILEKAGFWWQARRLRNHYHLAIKKGFLQLSKRADPIKEGLGGLS